MAQHAMSVAAAIYDDAANTLTLQLVFTDPAPAPPSGVDSEANNWHARSQTISVPVSLASRVPAPAWVGRYRDHTEQMQEVKWSGASWSSPTPVAG